MMILFDEEKVPESTYLGYMRYAVRPYVPPPLKTKGRKDSMEETEKNPLEVDKILFIAFIAEVVNCSAQTDSRTRELKLL